MSDAADLLMFHPAGHWSVQHRLTSQGWVRLKLPSAPRQPPVGFNFDHGRDQVETAPFSGDSLMCVDISFTLVSAGRGLGLINNQHYRVRPVREVASYRRTKGTGKLRDKQSYNYSE